MLWNTWKQVPKGFERDDNLDEKMYLLQIWLAQIWWKFVQTEEKIWTKVVNAIFAYYLHPDLFLSLHIYCAFPAKKI